MRSGFVAIVGRPNVGKSTLLNAVVGTKVAITTPVPQTTRTAVRGVLHREGVQVVFVDTPGMHKPKTLLGSRLNDTARGSLSGVDLICCLVDGAAGIGGGDRFMAQVCAEASAPAFGVVNKIDRVGRAAQLPLLAELDQIGDWDEIVPISAVTGAGVETLTDLICDRMPEGPPYFPEGQYSDVEPDMLVAEVIREAAIGRMREEVPHSIAAEVDELGPGDSDGVTAIQATLFVERDSQKGIVIGKGGQVLRDIGAQAREQLEVLLGTRVYLDLRVKLLKEWQRDPKALDRLGY